MNSPNCTKGSRPNILKTKQQIKRQAKGRQGEKITTTIKLPQLVDREFTERYYKGSINFEDPRIVSPYFETIYSALSGADFKFTADLEDDTCLIIPESAVAVTHLKRSKIERSKEPRIYIDSLVSDTNLLALHHLGYILTSTRAGKTDAGKTKTGKAEEYTEDKVQHHIYLARRIAGRTGLPAILLISASDWDNIALQTVLTNYGKPYCFALPDLSPDQRI
jgi:hypothetical protein